MTKIDKFWDKHAWQSFVTVVIAILLCLLFYGFNRKLREFYVFAPPEILQTLSVMSLIGSMVFFSLRYPQLPIVFSRLTKFTAFGVLFFLLYEPPSFTLVYDQSAAKQEYVQNFYWLAVSAAIISCWRPSFLFFPAFYALTTRYLVKAISGYPISTLDIVFLMETAQYLSISSCILIVYTFFYNRLTSSTPQQRGTLPTPLQLGNCFAFIAFGFHLGNYFWSAVFKLYLGPEMLSWLENPTYSLIILGLYKGLLPIGAFPEFTQWVFDLSKKYSLLVNSFVLFVQIIAIILPLRLLWLRLGTVAYDIFHIGIYFLGGLFFYPWIWSNVSILFALKKQSDESIGLAPKACCLIVVLMGYSHYLGESARLAWFDVVDIQHPQISVKTKTNPVWVEVPLSFFLSHSYALSQGHHGFATAADQYPYTYWGSTSDYNRMKTSGTCPPVEDVEHVTKKKFGGSGVERPDDRAARIEKIRLFLIAHHAKMREAEDSVFSKSYYYRGHHHISNPWLYSDFNKITLSEVEAYRYTIKSVCLSLDGGIVDEKLLSEQHSVFKLNK